MTTTLAHRAVVSAAVAFAAFHFGPAEAHVTASGSGGRVAHISAHADLLTLSNMLPGEEGQASVDLANAEAAAVPATVTIISVTDKAGQGGATLSSALELEVAGPGTVLYRGPFVAGREIGLGDLAAGETKRFGLTVRLRDGGRPTSLAGGDNALQDAGVAVELRWRVASVAPAPQAPRQQPAGSVLVIPVGSAASSAQDTRKQACLSRRRFSIRAREPRHSRLRSARVVVDGHGVKVRRRHGRLTAVVDLRGIRRQTVRVKIVARTRAGRRLVGSRAYRTCTAKLIGKRAPRL